MKRYGNLYEKICSMDNLREAHRNARKDKLFYKEVVMVDSDEEKYLTQIQDLLVNKKYEVSEYVVSVIHDKGKERELWKLPYFPDRIIQWAIMLQIEPIFDQVLTGFTCASLKDRGIHRAAKLTTRYLKDRPGTAYCLKIDIHHFYPSIDHVVLKALLRRKFKDPDLLELLDKIIDSHPPKGIPIGSYLSQYLANFYLSYFDHWLKEQMGVKYVIRYMDDIVILHYSKAFLHWLRIKMAEYLGKMGLQIKKNWQIFLTDSRGVDFVGYRFFHDFALLRKKTCQRFKRMMTAIRAKQDAGNMINYREWCSANSYAGWLKWCDSWRLFEKYVEPVIPSMVRYYSVVIKRNVEPEKKIISLEKYRNKIYEKKGRIAA